MVRHPRIARISITIPEDVLAEADRLARDEARPRSWVLTEAVRRWASKPTAQSPSPDWVAPPESERHSQLRSDMALPLGRRIEAAEEASYLDRLLRPPCPGLRITFFDRFEEYVAWKKQESIGR